MDIINGRRKYSIIMSDMQTQHLPFGRVQTKIRGIILILRNSKEQFSFQAFYQAACEHQLNQPIFHKHVSVDSPQKEPEIL
jgi:hypothetical protein